MTVDRKISPAIHDAIEFDYILPAIQEEKLDNGLPLYWLNAGVQDVAEIDWVFPAGIWYEPKDAVAFSTSGLIKNGTSKRSAHEINEALEFYGCSLKVNTGNDFSTISLHSLTKHLPAILPVIYEIITDAVFPENELNIYRQNSIQRLLVNLRQCEFVANQRIDAMLFGEQHPYGRFSKKETIEALTREDLVNYHRSNYDLGLVKIFMGGNVGDTEVKCINTIFGKTPVTKNEMPKPAFTAAPTTEKKTSIINDADGVQGAIRIGRIFPTRHHPDYAPMVVLNTLFGGYFGSRLMSNIREDKGYTYGIYSSQSPYVNGGSLIIQTEAGRDVLEAAVKEVYHEMELLCNEEAGEEELLLVKNYLLGGLLGDLDGPFSILQRWRTILLNGFTKDHFDTNIRTYKTVTAAELKVLANRYLKRDDFFEVVVV